MLRLERQKSFDQQPRARPRAEGWGEGRGVEGIKHRVARGKNNNNSGGNKKSSQEIYFETRTIFFTVNEEPRTSETAFLALSKRFSSFLCAVMWMRTFQSQIIYKRYIDNGE